MPNFVTDIFFRKRTHSKEDSTTDFQTVIACYGVESLTLLLKMIPLRTAQSQ